MNFFERIAYNIKENIIRKAPDDRIIVEAAIRKGDAKAPSKLIQYQSLLRRAQDLKSWKMAVSSASDPEQPSKLSLWEFYDNLLLDNHLRSCIDTRISAVQRSPFKLIDDSGKENDDATYLLDKPWIEDLISLIVMSRFQGTTLIELYDLNENAELEGITEIPMPYFNAHLGIISKDADEQNGWLYKELPFANNYMQVGNNKDLGELERLGPIVLAKKLALGAYQDYVDKYGIPPLFIITDREDDARLQQLYDAAVNFKSNAFMVGRGQEQFTIGNISGAGTAPFLELMNFVNDEISKAVLGGTGVNQEKAFVGSANIQMELAQNRIEADKKYFKNIFNEQIRPKLIALSPVYKPLEKLYWEWDDSESLNINEYITAVTQLGNLFEVDPQQIEERTGIKILGAKQPQMPDFGPPAGGEDEGK